MSINNFLLARSCDLRYSTMNFDIIFTPKMKATVELKSSGLGLSRVLNMVEVWRNTEIGI